MSKKYYDAKIKYFDDLHFKISLYSYRNAYDYELNECQYKPFEQLQMEFKETKDKSLGEMISDIKRSVIVSQNRAKNKIYDYARCNDFDYFVTITFNPDKVDSFNYDECTQKLSKWLNNIRSRYAPDLKYLFVPELHKSGRYHFHGLIANIGSIQMIDSGKRSNGQIVYNIGNYNYGFTTATRIVDKHRTSTYIGKYITKELSGHIKGKKHYWVSRNLNVPHEELLTLSELSAMGIDRDFLESNSVYTKEVEYVVGGIERKVTYYEFEKE